MSELTKLFEDENLKKNISSLLFFMSEVEKIVENPTSYDLHIALYMGVEKLKDFRLRTKQYKFWKFENVIPLDVYTVTSKECILDAKLTKNVICTELMEEESEKARAELLQNEDSKQKNSGKNKKNSLTSKERKKTSSTDNSKLATPERREDVSKESRSNSKEKKEKECSKPNVSTTIVPVRENESIPKTDSVRKEITGSLHTNEQEGNPLPLATTSIDTQLILKVMNRRFDAIEGEFGAFKTGFDELEKRFGALEERFGVLEERFDVLEERFDVLEEKFDVLEKRFDTMENRISSAIGMLYEMSLEQMLKDEGFEVECNVVYDEKKFGPQFDKLKKAKTLKNTWNNCLRNLEQQKRISTTQRYSLSFYSPSIEFNFIVRDNERVTTLVVEASTNNLTGNALIVKMLQLERQVRFFQACNCNNLDYVAFISPSLFTNTNAEMSKLITEFPGVFENLKNYKAKGRLFFNRKGARLKIE
ncbi:predicted protein [Naegleria gruberi]|uniref:Predicted protein n=1 Tax=Naegleria gruberi TaxID=5762 RepID=D2V4U9_NAEGR|nr:uncharacterized protein NAEGRDRAFT_46721 [Naegleria gruberi]EFC47996.1 predicted protein [Naegleria gruberi]|eukprot:XP_002680740.1 predicted protein [Naegleria gruberi strain NEG-M]